MLHSRKVDAIIIRTDNIDLSNYQSIQIIEEPLVAVLPKKYAEFTNKTSLSLSDLCSLPLITFDTTSDLYQTTQKLFKAKGINPHFSYLYQRHEQILSMINASFGAAIMPKHLVNTKSYPNLQLIPIEGAPNTTTSIVALKDACLSKELKLLFQYFSNITAE